MKHLRSLGLVIVLSMFSIGCQSSDPDRPGAGAKPDSAECASGGSAPCGGLEGSSGTRGGGDPNSVEFLQLAQNLSAWMLKYQTSDELAIDTATQFNDKVGQLIAMMDDENNPSIRFTDEPVVDASGTSKVALFSTDPEFILVNRKDWNALDLRDKYTVVALEIYGLINVERRYEEVATTILVNYSNIAEISGAIEDYKRIEATLAFSFYSDFNFNFHEIEEEMNLTEAPWNDMGWARKQWELLTKMQRAQSYYHDLPVTFKVDSFLGGLAKYFYLSSNNYQVGVSELRGMDPYPYLASEYLQYVIQKTTMNLRRANAYLPEEQREKASALVAKYNTIVERWLEKLEHVKGNEYVSYTLSPYTEYYKAFQNKYLKLLSENSCKVPTSFPGPGFGQSELQRRVDEAMASEDQDLDMVKAVAEAEMDAMREMFKQANKELNELINNADIHKHTGDGFNTLNGLREVHEILDEMRSVIFYMNARFVNFTMKPIEEAWERGVLCIK